MIAGSVLDLRMHMVSSSVNNKNCAKPDGLVISYKEKLIDEWGKVLRIAVRFCFVTNLDWMMQ